MAYNNGYYKKAIEIILADKKARQKQYEQRLNELYNSVPELGDIDAELSSIGAKAMMAAMAGKTDDVKIYELKSAELQAKKAEIFKSTEIQAPVASCQKCNDTGYLGNSLCECVKLIAKKLVMQDMSEQMPIEEQGFHNFDLKYYPDVSGKDGINPREHMGNIFNTIKNYADSFSRHSENLILIGNVGLGKTHLTMAIIKSVIEKGYGVIYGSAQNLFLQVQNEYLLNAGSMDKLDAILNIDLLVIDDLGAEIQSSFAKNLVNNIINTRINNSLPTIINTNLSFSQIEEYYTARVSSRIVGNYKLIPFYGKDIRRIKALNK